MMTLQFAVPRVGSFLLCGPCPSFTPAYHGSRPRELGATTIMPDSSLFWLNETNEWMSETDKAAWVMLLRIPLEMNYSMKEIYSTRSSWAICPHIVLKSHLQTEQRWQQWRFSSWWCPRGALDTSAGGKNCKGEGRDHHLLQNCRPPWSQVLFWLPSTDITRIKALWGQELDLLCSLLCA